MSSIGSPSPFFLAGKKAYQVERSLRFNTTDQTEVTNTSLGTSPTNRKILTVSLWFKRSSLSASETGLITYGYSGSGGSQSNSGLRFVNSDVNLSINNEVNNSTAWSLVTSRVFKDFSAWYHIVVAIDTTQSTASDRVKVYINGIQETSFSTANYPSQNYDSLWLYSNVRIGASDGGGSYYAGWNGYIAEYNAIDGQALTPASFGETDATTGQWNPIKYTGSYGTNGHYLNFSDNSGTTATTLGKDSSGNGNNFTPTNLATSDAVKDSPTNNFCVFNLLSKDGGSTLSNGNLQISSSDYGNNTGTFFLTSGKWYWEALGNGYVGGICGNSGQNYSFSISGSGSKSIGYWHLNGWAYWDGGNSGAGTSYSTSDVIGIALDMDNGTLKFYKNNTLIHDLTFGSGTIPDLSSGAFPVWNNGTSNNSKSANYNFGQDSSFAGNKTAQGNTDGSGQGDFYYAPPTGFKALCSANLPDPTILLPNKHFGTLLYTGNGSTKSVTDTTAVNFTPDWSWFKARSASISGLMYDAVRGNSKYLQVNSTSAEGTDATSQTAFISGGFSLGSDGTTGVNQNTTTYVAWNWNAGDTDGKTYTVKVVSDGGNKYRFDDFGTSAVTLDLAEGGTYIFDGANSSMASHPIKLSETSNGTHGGGSSYNTGVTYLLDGASVTESAYVSGYASATTRQLKIVVAASAPTLYYYCHYHSGMGGQVNTNSTLGSSNFDGTIQSVAKVNASAGFSITKYTGTGSDATVGHGLGVKPDSVIVKRRTGGASDWFVFHKDIGNTKNLRLNLSNSVFTTANIWDNTDPTSSVVNIGFSSAVNGSGSTYVMYCFSEVAGYSKFGSYTGNGSSDGPFVFTGFRPAVIILKNTSRAEDWVIRDKKHSGYTTMNGNPVNIGLRPNTNDSYSGGSNLGMDFLSNGFKLRGSDNDVNKSGDTYVYMCFAESPFKNARAR